MPPEATDKTFYLCRFCAELGVAKGAEFDRCAFDDAGIRSDQSSSDWVDGGKSIASFLFAHSEGLAAFNRSLFQQSMEDWIDQGKSMKDFFRKRSGAYVLEDMSKGAPSTRIMRRRQEEHDDCVAASRENFKRLFVKPRDKRKACMFVAHYWSGLSQEEIAKEFGCTVGAVKQNILRVRNILKNNRLPENQ
jgi:hypothetical protein